MKFQVIGILALFIQATLQSISPDNSTADVVWTETDGTAELPCKGDNNRTDVAMILWFKGSTGIPLYSIDIRGRKEASHSALTSNLGMRSYYLEGTPGRLKIQRIVPSDAGIYRCRIDYVNAPSSNYIVNVTLIVPPSDPNIYFEDGDDVRDVAGPYLEGHDIRLTCIVHGGEPKPMVNWMIGNMKVDGVETKSLPGSVHISRLHLGPVTRNLQGKVISCQALSALGTRPRTKSVALALYLRPTSVKIVTAPTYMSSGTMHQIVCTTQGSLPPANITWLLDGEQIRNSIISVKIGAKETTSVLNLKAQWSDDGKLLTCKASNSKYPHFYMSEDRHLKVGYPPVVAVRIISDGNSTTFKEGDDITLACVVKSSPPVYSVVWYHKTSAYPMATGDSDENHTLRLRNVTMEQGGEYSCVAKNNEGTSRSIPTFLVIRHAPVCKQGEVKKTIGLLKHQTIFLSCEVEANPSTDLKFRWTFNNSKDVLPLPAAWMKTTGSVSFFNYTPASDIDFGTLGCWAENEVGRQKEPCLTELIQGSLPAPPSDCEVSHNNETDKLRLVCVPGNDDKEVAEYHYVVDVNEIDTSEHGGSGVMGDQPIGPPLYRILSEIPQFSLDKLMPNRDYKLEIYARNVYGLSHPPCIINGVRFPKKEATFQGRDLIKDNLEPQLIYVAICIGGMIVVLFIVFSIVFKCTRKKRRSEKQNNVTLNNLGPSVAGIRDNEADDEAYHFIDT